MKKIYLLTIISFLAFYGCFMEKKNDEGKGVKIIREGSCVTVSAEKECIAGSYVVDREINESDIVTEADKLKIVKKESGKTYIDIVDLDENIKADNVIFKINNCSEFVTVKEIESINREEFSQKAEQIEKRVEVLEELLGDFNNNSEVELSDFTIFKTNYGTDSVVYDIGPAQLGSSIKHSKIYSKRSRDNKVNLMDFLIFGKNYGIKIDGPTVREIKITPEFPKRIEVGMIIKFSIVVVYSDGTEKPEEAIIFSSDSSVLTVSSVGTLNTIKAVKEGTAHLTFRIRDISTNTVFVIDGVRKMEKIDIEGADSVEIGESTQLNGKVIYSDMSYALYRYGLSWKSSDETVATVDETGRITGKKEGTVTITASKEGFSSSKKISVVNSKQGITLYIDDSYGDQIYAWDGKGKELNGPWPGKKIIEKSGNFNKLSFGTDLATVNYIIFKNNKKVCGDKSTTATVWIDSIGNSKVEEYNNRKPIIIANRYIKSAGDSVEIKIMNFEAGEVNASLGGKTIPISKTGGMIKLADYIQNLQFNVLKVESKNSIGTTIMEMGITRDDLLPLIPKDKINNTCYQAFYWESAGGLWNRLKSKIPEFAEIGVTSMWLPPANKCGSGASDVGYGTYDLWDLGEFNQKDTVATRWGSKGELESLLSEMHGNGMNAYYDVILNHKYGADGQETFSGRTAWTKYNPVGRNKYYSKASNWSWNHDCFDGDGNGIFPGKTWDNAIEPWLCCEDVDYDNGNVVDETKEWGKWITTDIGFDGFRMDAIKHVKDSFVKDWANYIKSVTGKNDMFFVGEAWIEDVNGLKNYLNAVGNSIKVFDFPLRNDFVSLSSGSKDLRFWGGLVNSDKSSSAVTFVDNHDTCRNGNPYKKPQVVRFKNQAYAYIMINAKGTPCVYAKDYEEYGMKYSLDKIITARRYYAYGEGVEQLSNDSDVYSYVRKGIAEAPKSGCVLMISDGTSGNTVVKKINSFKPNTEYYDITENISETVKTDSNGNGEFKVIQSESKGWSIWVQK